MRKLEIDERDFKTPEELMGYLAKELRFPAYFGGTLPAFRDCLGDIAEPTRIRVRRRSPEGRTWFEAATLALLRAACENDQLSVRVSAG